MTKPQPPAPDSLPVLRDSIWYETPEAGEWLKTRDLEEAMEKVRRLLKLTTFSGWKEVRLELHVCTSSGMLRLYDSLYPSKETRSRRRWTKPVLDEATVRAHHVDGDGLLLEAIRQFGSPQLQEWGIAPSADNATRGFTFRWEATRDLPESWLVFCDQHRDAVLNERPCVEIVLRAEQLDWIEPRTGELLRYQGETQYPPIENTPSWPVHSSLAIYLPRCRMYLYARLPFLSDGADLRRYRGHLRDAVGYDLSAKHFRALLINQEGTGTYARKELPARALPPRQPQPGAQERRDRRKARRLAIF